MTELLMSAPRKRRCRLLDEHGNRCANEALSDYGLCLADLREAADEWAHIVNGAVEQFPGLKRILGRRDGNGR